MCSSDLGLQETNWAAVRNATPGGTPVTPGGLPAASASSSKRNTGALRTGWGMGCEMHGSSAYPGIKERGNAIVNMNEDGTVTLMTGAAGLGTGAHTALAQIVAEELGVRFEDVSVVHGDTDIVPWDIGAFASHTANRGLPPALASIASSTGPLSGCGDEAMAMERIEAESSGSSVMSTTSVRNGVS